MRSPTVCSIIIASFFVSFIICALEVEAESDVIELNDSNFEKLVSSEKPWLIEFFAPWCGHCKSLVPTWETLATQLKGKVNIAKVDCTQNKELAQKYEIRGFPTIKLFLNGHNGPQIKHSGQRDVTSFKEFLVKNKVFGPPKVILKYFQVRGRGELIRLALEAAGVKYEQQLHSNEEWPQLKTQGLQDGTLTFGQVPALQYDDLHMVQTIAILRYIGRKHQLMPSEDPAQLKVDIIVAGTEDLRTKYSQLVYNANFQKERENYVKVTLNEWLSHFERLLNGNKEQLFFVGDTLTIADLAVFEVLNVHLALDPHCLSNFDLLNKFYQHKKELPRIADYLASDRRPKYQNGARAFFDNEATAVKEDL